MGSWSCLIGAALTAAGLGWGWVIGGITVGYSFAFAGHRVALNNILTSE